jgi:hypothetical protein
MLNRHIVLAGMLAAAAPAAIQAQGSTSGFFIGAQATGAGINFSGAAQRVDFGGGYGLHVGLGLGETFGVVANYDRNNLSNATGGGSYDLGQYDLLGRLSFLDGRSVIRPYITAGVTGRVAKTSTFTGTNGDYKLSSTSPTLGAGAQLFLTRALAVDATALWTFGDLRVENNNGFFTTSRYSSTGTRVAVGVSFYPFN